MIFHTVYIKFCSNLGENIASVCQVCLIFLAISRKRLVIKHKNYKFQTFFRSVESAIQVFAIQFKTLSFNYGITVHEQNFTITNHG